MNNRGLTYMYLPSATAIGDQSFRACHVLEKVDLPVLANFASRQALMDSRALAAVILRNTSVVCSLCHTDVFQGTAIASGTGYIYVPRALVDSYKTATNWSTYAAQIRAIEDYPDICGGE